MNDLVKMLRDGQMSDLVKTLYFLNNKAAYEIERLECELAISRGKHKNAIAEIEQIGADLELSMNQCDWWVGELEATEAEIERLKIEASCNYCGSYHGKEVCETLLAEIERLYGLRDRLLKEIERLRAVVEHCAVVRMCSKCADALEDK